jgi:hypothetical protein
MSLLVKLGKFRWRGCSGHRKIANSGAPNRRGFVTKTAFCVRARTLFPIEITQGRDPTAVLQKKPARSTEDRNPHDGR